jgi:hypothetical protein
MGRGAVVVGLCELCLTARTSPSSLEFYFIFIFLFILETYTTISKFSKINLSPR